MKAQPPPSYATLRWAYSNTSLYKSSAQALPAQKPSVTGLRSVGGGSFCVRCRTSFTQWRAIAPLSSARHYTPSLVPSVSAFARCPYSRSPIPPVVALSSPIDPSHMQASLQSRFALLWGGAPIRALRVGGPLPSLLQSLKNPYLIPLEVAVRFAPASLFLFCQNLTRVHKRLPRGHPAFGWASTFLPIRGDTPPSAGRPFLQSPPESALAGLPVKGLCARIGACAVTPPLPRGRSRALSFYSLLLSCPFSFVDNAFKLFLLPTLWLPFSKIAQGNQMFKVYSA